MLAKTYHNSDSNDIFGNLEAVSKIVSNGTVISWRYEDVILREPTIDCYKICQKKKFDHDFKSSSDYWSNGAKNIVKDYEFHRFFNIRESLREIIDTGYSDFDNKILGLNIFESSKIKKTVTIEEYLHPISDKASMEIGFGSGRLMNASCKKFDHSYGLDIHNYFDRTEDFLKDSKNNNFTLIRPENKSEVDNESIDLLYSFIVFQHLDTLKDAIEYIQYASRILKPNGIGLIYLGLNNLLPFVGALEIKNIEKGGCSLLFNPLYAKKIIEKSGLQVLTTEVDESHRQIYVIFKKG